MSGAGDQAALAWHRFTTGGSTVSAVTVTADFLRASATLVGHLTPKRAVGGDLRTSSTRPPAAEHRNPAPEAKRTRAAVVFTSPPPAEQDGTAGLERRERPGRHRAVRASCSDPRAFAAEADHPGPFTATDALTILMAATQPHDGSRHGRDEDPRGHLGSATLARLDGANEPPGEGAGTAQTIHHQPQKPAASAIHRPSRFRPRVSRMTFPALPIATPRAPSPRSP